MEMQPFPPSKETTSSPPNSYIAAVMKEAEAHFGLTELGSAPSAEPSGGEQCTSTTSPTLPSPAEPGESPSKTARLVPNWLFNAL